MGDEKPLLMMIRSGFFVLLWWISPPCPLPVCILSLMVLFASETISNVSVFGGDIAWIIVFSRLDSHGSMFGGDTTKGTGVLVQRTHISLPSFGFSPVPPLP